MKIQQRKQSMFENIKLAKFRIELTAETEIRLPPYAGSTLRGAFGSSFRQTVCTMGDTGCSQCLLQSKCVYHQIFETPVTQDAPRFLRGVKTAPRPFIIEPPVQHSGLFKPGDTLRFHLVLIGSFAGYLPFFVQSFIRMAQKGFGKGRGRARLTHVFQLNPDGTERLTYNGESHLLDFNVQTYSPTAWYNGALPNGNELDLEFITPTRLKHQGRITTEITPRQLVFALYNRCNQLNFFHCNGADNPDYLKELLTASENIEFTHRNIRWHDWERYSQRQQTRMKLGGFLGKLGLRGDLAPLWLLFKTGELLHIGKATTFGLGKYEIIAEY